ncbi:thymidine kinase, cytosolic-like [Amphiura filiformis]|uniref:thymidine kinase, cytosolic-like n=1 Tax=Amphiura filiformis TaxID=82378 RepID=UPI003B211D0E
MMACTDSLNIGACRKRGQIQVIFGPMFSGKSTELLRRIKRFQIANYTCLLIKYAKDTRYDENGVATHDRQVSEATPTEKLYALAEKAEHCQVIGIDEGQFFPDCVKFAEEMANKGKIVIVAALDGTYQRKGFGDILSLVPLAENVIKLNAVCMQCYREASYTKRIGMETDVEVIGGADKYMAVCRDCYKIPGDELTSLSLESSDQKTPTSVDMAASAKSRGRVLFPIENTKCISTGGH